MVEWMLLPTRSAIGRTPARSCTSISPRWYFALTSYLSLRPHLLLLLYESCLRQSGRRATPLTMAPPSPPRPPPPAKRKALAACYAWQPCEVAAEQLAHLRLIPRVERDLRFRKLA